MNLIHRARILVIEDEQDIRDLVTLHLISKGHQVVACVSSEAALLQLQTETSWDLILIDWMLPGMSGLDFCTYLRSKPHFDQTPIMMLTALTQNENIVQGLDAGANDYLTKPFDLEVFEARVRSLLRLREKLGMKPSPSLSTDIFEHECLRIDHPRCRVLVEGVEVHLTTTEFKILSGLSSKPGHVFTRDQLIGKIQGEQVYVTGRTIDTHMAGLRKKLGAAGIYLETIRGIGYRFTDRLETQLDIAR